MPRYSLLLFLLPFPLTAQPEAAIHQEYRYQLPKSATPWTAVEGLPSGLRLLPESNELWGAPNEAGQYTFALRSGDGKQVTLNLKVNALWNLSLTPPQAAVGVPFSHAQVVGGGTPPYTFAATGLPPGLALSLGGQISGTPVKAGTYSATVIAVDHQGNTLTLPYSLKVEPIGILPAVLPYAEAGKPYSQQLTATGGKAPYTWSLADDSACDGLAQRPVLAFPTDAIGYLIEFSEPPPIHLTPDGRLVIEQPIHSTQTLCLQVADSAGNTTLSVRTVIPPPPEGSSLRALLNPSFAEVSVGDPMYIILDRYSGASPYSGRALALPPGFAFYPEPGLVIGFPQTAGDMTIRIEASDAAGATFLCENTFHVSPIRVTGTSPATPTLGKPYANQFYALNAAPPVTWMPASDPLSLSNQLPAGLTFNSSGLLSGTPQEAGSFYARGRVRDAFGNSHAFKLIGDVSAGTHDTLDIAGNDTPFLTLNRVSTYSLYQDARGQAPFAWTISGGLPPGMTSQDDPSGRLTFWGVPSVSGAYPVTVRVTDAQGNAGIRLIPLRVGPLHRDVRHLRDGVTGTMNQFQLDMEGGAPPYRWSAAPGQLPPGMSLSASGIFSGIPSRSAYFTFAVAVTDAASNTVAVDFTWETFAIRILTPMELPPVRLGEPLSLQLQALSASPGYTWTLQDASSCYGLTLSPAGLLSGRPGYGSYCGLVVTDAKGNMALSSIRFDVIGDGQPDPPRISGPIAANVSVASSFSRNLDICCAWPYALAALPASGLPPGLTLTDEVLSGYATKPGRYAFEIQVTDALGGHAATRAYFTVSPLHIVPVVPAGFYNQPYSYQFRVLEPQQPLLWSIDPADRLPAGLKLSPEGLLSGIPVETGSFGFSVRANDAVAGVTLMIASGALNTVSADAELPLPADVGQPFEHWLRISGTPTGGPIAKLSSGAIPPGLQLSTNGEISGTPTTAGVYTFSIRLDDFLGDFGYTVVTIRVGVTQSETRALPIATIDKPYTTQLQGGILNPGDTLPDGLALNPDGKLSGTPTTQWLYRFSVLLTEATGDAVISTYTLEVTR